MDPDEQRRGGQGRAPVSRQGRRQPPPRRTAPARAGGPRRSGGPRRPAPRRERPAPPSRQPYDDLPYEDAPQRGASPLADPHGAGPPQRPSERGLRGRRPKESGTAAKRGTADKPARPAGPAGLLALLGPAGAPGPKLYFGAAAVLGVLVLVGLGVVVLTGGKNPDPGAAANAKIGVPAGNGPSPTSYSSSPSSDAYAGIASRRADPKPLTIGEAFPSSAAKLSVPDGKVTVKLRAKRLDGDCAAAVWGATVGAALGKGGCTQAARGIYSDTEHGYAVAVAVFNLAGSADADRFVAKLETTIGGGFVLPLKAPEPLDEFGRGFSMARGLAMGHFAVVSWVQRLDGQGDGQDETLLSLLIEGGKAPAVLGRAARASD